MKFLGFIKEHDDITGALPFRDRVDRKQPPHADVDLIIQYLSSGSLVFGWMGHFQDLETREWIALDAYHTDGLWIWPAYLPHYLKKYPTLFLEEEFLIHVRNKQHHLTIPAGSGVSVSDWEQQLHKKLKGE